MIVQDSSIPYLLLQHKTYNNILYRALSQFTRNYTQTTKQGLLTTNKGWVSSTGKVRDIQPVLLSGVSKGYPFGTRLCLQSVVCYTLCRRCCENAVATGKGKHIWSSRKTGLWLCGVEPQAQGWFRQQIGRIWKPPSLVLRRTSGQNIPNLWTHSRKNWNGREAILRLSRLDWLLAKTGRTVNGGAWNVPFILTVDWLDWICYLSDKWEIELI